MPALGDISERDASLEGCGLDADRGRSRYWRCLIWSYREVPSVNGAIRKGCPVFYMAASLCEADRGRAVEVLRSASSDSAMPNTSLMTFACAGVNVERLERRRFTSRYTSVGAFGSITSLRCDASAAALSSSRSVSLSDSATANRSTNSGVGGPLSPTSSAEM